MARSFDSELLDFAEVIGLADFDTTGAQHAVRGGGVEIQIGQTVA